MRLSGGKIIVQRQRTAYGVQQPTWTRKRSPETLVTAVWCSVKVTDQLLVASATWICWTLFRNRINLTSSLSSIVSLVFLIDIYMVVMGMM